MGYATYAKGYRGIVRQRDYRVLVYSAIEPAVYVDGVATSWRQVTVIGTVKETVKEIVGLSYTDAMATGAVSIGSNATITLSPDSTYQGTASVETYSREIERHREGDSNLWTVTITERTTSYS